jgi:hypothetical protein
MNGQKPSIAYIFQTKGKDEKPQKLRNLPTFSPKTSQLAKPNSLIHSNTRAERERESVIRIGVLN